MSKNTNHTNTIIHGVSGLVIAAALAAAAGLDASASVLSPVVRVGDRIAARVLPCVAAPAVRGGAKLAAVTAERAAARCATAEIAGKVSAKQILAVGTGAALVTAAHESADGVQGLCEAAGQTIRENPDKVDHFLDMLRRPFNALMTIVGIAVVGLAWLLVGPWVGLYRTEVAAWTAKHAHKRTVGLSGKINLSMVIALSCFFLLTLLGIVTHCTKRDIGKHGASGKRVDRSAEVAQLRSDYANEIKVLHDRFVREVGEVSAAEFGKVRNGVPAVAARFGMFSRCKDLVKTMVIDKIKGGDRTGESIRRDLEADYYRGLYSANDAVNGCVVRFVAELAACREKYMIAQKDLTGVALRDDTEYVRLLQDGGDQIEARKDNLKAGQNAAALAVALEAICIRKTVSTVAKILGKAVARQVGTMAGGAAAAVADGPLPIGDVLAALAVSGCTLWTLYDIWQATKVLPRELRQTLDAVVCQCEAESRTTALAAGDRAVREATADVQELYIQSEYAILYGVLRDTEFRGQSTIIN